MAKCGVNLNSIKSIAVGENEREIEIKMPTYRRLGRLPRARRARSKLFDVHGRSRDYRVGDGFPRPFRTSPQSVFGIFK